MSFATALTAFAAAFIPLGTGTRRARRDKSGEAARRQASREYEHLLRLPDHLLRDIGVCRADVEAELRSVSRR